MSAKTGDSKPSGGEALHVRRCHVCGTVNECEGSPGEYCSHCGKFLAPFYFFDAHGLRGLTELGPFNSVLKHRRGYQPIWGIAVYWD